MHLMSLLTVGFKAFFFEDMVVILLQEGRQGGGAGSRGREGLGWHLPRGEYIDVRVNVRTWR